MADDGSSWNSTSLDTQEQYLFASHTPLPSARHVDLIKYTEHTFEGATHVYVVLEGVPLVSPTNLTGSHPKYQIFFTQAQVSNLHLFVFFTAFFCCFYLVLFVAGVVFSIKAAQFER